MEDLNNNTIKRAPLEHENRHHVAHFGEAWRGVELPRKRKDLYHKIHGRKIGLALRGNPRLIIPMCYGVHKMLHEYTPGVPVVSSRAMVDIVREFESYGFPENIYPVLAIKGVQRAMEQKNSKVWAWDDREIRDMALVALEAQIPFIQFSLENRYDLSVSQRRRAIVREFEGRLRSEYEPHKNIMADAEMQCWYDMESETEELEGAHTLR